MLRERTLNVKIPRGILSGQHIRLAGQGEKPAGGGESGDLFLEVSFAPHPLFRPDGRDLHLELPVAPWEASLGASVNVPTPAGTVELKVPAGSKGGSTVATAWTRIARRSPWGSLCDPADRTAAGRE